MLFDDNGIDLGCNAIVVEMLFRNMGSCRKGGNRVNFAGNAN